MLVLSETYPGRQENPFRTAIYRGVAMQYASVYSRHNHQKTVNYLGHFPRITMICCGKEDCSKDTFPIL